jgi:hypothetical protein
MADTDQIWISANDAVRMLLPVVGAVDLAGEILVDELAAGLAPSRCRRYVKERVDSGWRELLDDSPIPNAFWRRFDDPANRLDVQWINSHLSVRYLERNLHPVIEHVHGVQVGVAEVRAMSCFSNAAPATPAVWMKAPDAAGSTKTRKLPLASAEQIERFCRVILDGAGRVPIEADAYRAARAALAQNHVPRDRFLEVFRVIRGRKNRGPSKR